MQNARYLIVFLALMCISLCAYNIYTIEQERKVLKEDLIELSKIKYGLFSVDVWKDLFSEIIANKIEELEFSPEEKEVTKDKVSTFLYRAIDEMETRFNDEQSESVSGLVKIGIANLTDMFGEIKKNVPSYTDQILTFLSAPENRENVKTYISEKLSEYADNTFSKIDYAERDQILAKYNYLDTQQAVSGLQAEVALYDIMLKKYLFAGLFIALLCAIGIMFAPEVSKGEFVMYTLISLGLLFSGLILPMIEIDARIADISFSVLGEQITFSDQVLYYKSKSILEVVQLMLTQGKPDVLIVGVLVLMFSVIFPVAKLISSMIYLFIPSLGTNRFMRFMVFRTGKWSMADVMVIAIFMAFIGFRGILTEQLSQLDSLSSNLDVLTTNRSSLQDGFFLFTTFVVLSLLVTHRLQFKQEDIVTAEAVVEAEAPLTEEE